MKKRVLKILLYIIGILCIAYPIYSRFLAYKNQTESIYDYKKELAIMQEEELKEKLKKSEEFNANNSSETSVIDPSSITAKDDESSSSYNFLQLGEMIGYISIPKINIELPIYEGVTVNNLTKGVSHMENTSLPNGNINTHAVLAGHTGISQAEIFDNISELKTGDEFFVTFYNKTTKYKVVYETVVLPENTTNLKVEQGRCLVTLVTCTPKSVNTHRLLVTGEKVDEAEEIIKDEQDNIDAIVPAEEIVVKSDLALFGEFVIRNSKLFIALLIVLILLIILNIVTYIKNKINKHSEGE